MDQLSALFALCLFGWTSVPAASQQKTTVNYLNELGLSSEEHEVITEDGYKLKLFRIPRKAGIPVLLVHGFMGTSDMWVLMERQYNLATILADNGYDVWITNHRGNIYSHNHVKYRSDVNSFEYWNFSADDIATKDIPATVDFINFRTGMQKLHYVGHSMGSSLLLILCSQMPQYCSRKFHTSLLLAPIAYPPQNVRLPTINFIVQWGNVISDSLRRKRIYEFLGRNQTVVDFLYGSCFSHNNIVCRGILEFVLHFDKQNSLPRPIGDYVASILGGTSVNVFDQMTTIMSKNGNFAPYSALKRSVYAPTPHHNLRSVNSSSYAIENIEVPVILISGSDDLFVDEQALNKLRKKLKRIVADISIPPPFKHMGYYFDLKNNYGIVIQLLKILNKFEFSGRWWNH